MENGGKVKICIGIRFQWWEGRMCKRLGKKSTLKICISGYKRAFAIIMNGFNGATKSNYFGGELVRRTKI